MQHYKGYKIILSLLILVFNISMGVGQDQIKISVTDSIQIDKWSLQADKLIETNPDSAFLLVNQALDLSEKYEHQSSQVKLLRIKGLIYFEIEQDDEAIEYCKQALALAEKTNYPAADAAKSLAFIYFVLNDLEKAIAHYQLADEYASQENKPLIQINALHNLANIFSNLGRQQEAKEHYFKCLEVQRTSKETKSEIGVLKGLVKTYLEMNEVDQGKKYYEEGLELAKSNGDLQALGLFHLDIANIYHNKGFKEQSLKLIENALEYEESLTAKDREKLDLLRAKFDLALDDPASVLLFSQRGIRITKENNNELKLSEFYGHAGAAYLQSAQVDSALYYFQQCLNLKVKLNLESKMLYPLINIVKCHEDLNQLDSALFYIKQASLVENIHSEPRNRIDLHLTKASVFKKKNEPLQAIKYGEEAFNLAEKWGLKELIAVASDGLYPLYEEQEDYQAAFTHFKTYQTLQDSLFGEKQTRKLIKLKAQYEFEKDKELLIQKNETAQLEYDLGIRRQKLWVALSLLALLLSLIGIFALSKYQKSKREHAVEKERLRADLKSNQLKIEKKEREKLQVMDDFKSKLFTDISHELRTPLSIIMGMNEKIKEDPEQWLHQGTDLVRKNTGQMLDLVNQILLLQSLESNKLEPKNINADIQSHLKNLFFSLEHLAESKGVMMRFEADDDPIMMDYDPEKIRWIASNLLSNAIKFTPENGLITMQITTHNNKVLIEVSDSGIGMSEEDQSKIFDRYFQKSSSYNPTGSGVGLALVKELVNLLNGEIKVESELNKGSIFKVSLPIINMGNVASEEIDANRQSNSGKISKITKEGAVFSLGNQLEILIIEDNFDMQTLLSACLKDKYKIYTAKDGEKGIKQAIEKMPDIIISDVMMPVKDGYEVCNTLKLDERTSHIPIILLTAKADQKSKIEGLVKGADAYLTKPFDNDELHLRIENLLKFQETLRKRYATMIIEEPENKIELNLDDAFIKKIKDYIEHNIEKEDFEIKNICQHLHLSRSQLFRKVKALTGKSPTRFIRSIRLNVARNLLKTSEITVSQAAFKTGFASSSYFSNCFYEEFKERPSAILN